MFICVACSNVDINADLDSIFSNFNNTSTYNTNNTLKYYSYYLPSDFGEEDINSDSITLKYGESSIIMNLNIADIINSKYYSSISLSDDGFYNNDYLIYENDGLYISNNETEKQYIFRLYDYDTYYALYLKTTDNIFYGSVVKGDIKDITRQLLIIVKSVNVDNDLIISTYSNKDTIDYEKKQLDLFNYHKPSNGTLGEMLTDDATVGNQEVSDNSTDNNN